ncbi:MAG: hypothetical protein HY645_06720 [Acidobacteria bacterium]|nr:hypothetical protein [Acidobacteriota bacterium]
MATKAAKIVTTTILRIVFSVAALPLRTFKIAVHTHPSIAELRHEKLAAVQEVIRSQVLLTLLVKYVSLQRHCLTLLGKSRN